MIGVLLVGVVAILVGQVGGAANTPRGDRAAILKCQAIVPIASGYGAVTAVWRAETSTAAAVAYWQEHRGRLRAAPSPFGKLAAQTPVTVCLLSGEQWTALLAAERTGVRSASLRRWIVDLPHTVRRWCHGAHQPPEEA